MDEKDRIVIADTSQGIVTSESEKNAGIAESSLSELCEDGKLARIQYGVNISENAWMYDFFLYQHRFPKGIFSHETALYLHGYSDRIPDHYSMSFPYGENMSLIEEAGVRPFVLRKNHELGKTTVTTLGEYVISVYSIERTLIDILKPKSQEDNQIIALAYKQYVKTPKRDISLLMDYAEIFRVKEKVMSYINMLL